MSEIVWAFSALAVAILFRFIPRVIWPSLTGTDTWFHMLYMDLIRENGHRVPGRHPRILGPGHYTYPAFYHWVLSYFRARAVSLIDRFGGLVYDLIAGGALAVLLVWTVDVSRPTAIFSVALYMLHPGLVLFHIGPRAFSLTPRILAQTLYALAFCLLAIIDPSDQILPALALYFLAVVAFALMLLTAKFPLQHIVFTLPIAAVVAGRIDILLAGLCAFPVAWAVSRGFLWTQLRGQYDHLRWYLRRNQGMVAHRANWSRIFDALRRGHVRALVVEAFWHNPILSGLARHFPLFIALGWSLYQPPTGEAAELAWALSVAALVPWILTSFGALRIFGESERYLEFAAPTSWYLLWSLAGPVETLWLATLLGAAFLIAYAANLPVLAAAAKAFGTEDAEGLASVLQNHGNAVALCLHAPEAQLFLHRSGIQLVDLNGTLSERGECGSFLGWLFWRYPYVSPERLSEIVARYNVELIVEKISARRRMVELHGRDYDMSTFREIYRNSTYILYQMTPTEVS